MKRRALLSAGTLLAIGVAGCTTAQGPDDGPDGDQPSRPTETETSTPTADPNPRLAGFEGHLRTVDVSVRTLEVRDRLVRLVYETDRREAQAVSNQIGRISGFYFREVREGWDVDRLDAEAHAGDGTVFTWHARTEWYEQYAAGERSANALTLAVLETAEREQTG